MSLWTQSTDDFERSTTARHLNPASEGSRGSVATSPESKVLCKVLNTLAGWNQVIANMIEPQPFVK
jgi:hypothetical protein